jgi:hypothetical protein
MRLRAAFAVASLLWATTAGAASTKTFPSAGITHIHRWDWNVRGALQDYHVLLVEIGNPAIRFGVTKEADRNHTVTWFATNYKPLVAVNGSMFNFTEHAPCGAAQSGGTFYKTAWGPSCTTTVGLATGRVGIADNGGTLTGPWPSALSFATDGLSGNPWLIRDGKSTSPWTFPSSINNRAARTAVGITSTGKTLILVTVDGGRTNAQGMTGGDLVSVFSEFLAHQALYLDGTNATALWVGKEGGLQNVPADAGKEQAVSNALMILAPAPVVMDAGPETTSIDASMIDSTIVEDTAVTIDAGGTGPEDPTGDAGESLDGTISDGVPTGLGGSVADDASCSAHRSLTGAAGWHWLVALLGLIRMAGRRRA